MPAIVLAGLAVLASMVAGAAAGPAEAAAPIMPMAVTDGQRYVPMSPARLMDTRAGEKTIDGQGPKGAVPGPGQVDLLVAGRAGIPATGVGAVVLNVTVTGPTRQGWVTAWPTGQARPLASNLNYTLGQTVANMVIAQVGTGGKVSLFNNTGSTHLIVDVMGWYPTGGDLRSFAPARVMDTRPGNATVDGQGRKGAVVGPGQVDLQVAGRAGIPASGAGAVVLNVTVNQPTGNGWVTVWPTGQARPLASNLNYVAGQTVPNMVIAKVGAGGKVSLFNNFGSAHLIVDVMGWFPTDAELQSMTPARLADTRAGNPTVDGAGPKGAVAGSTSIDVVVAGRAGVPASGVGAVVLNVTVTQPTGKGWVSVWPARDFRPLASNLNYNPGQTVANMVIVKVGAEGKVSLFNSNGATHLIVDVMGWIPGGAAAPGSIQKIAAGSNHTCAIVAGGQVKCWGKNDYGQLGNGAIADRSAPVTVAGITGATSLAAAGGHSCALVAGGQVKCWGHNDYGQLGDGTTTDRTTPVNVAGITGATSLAAGFSHSCAVVADGQVRCWGLNDRGQLGDGSTTDRTTPVSVAGVTGATSLAAGYDHSCALVAGGEVECWGDNMFDQISKDPATYLTTTPVRVDGITGATVLAANHSHSCVIVGGGRIECWGSNTFGQRNASHITGATAIAAGWGHTCAISVNNRVDCWGYNGDGYLGDYIEPSWSAQVPVSWATGATIITAGDSHRCVVREAGRVGCWGEDFYWQTDAAGVTVQ